MSPEIAAIESELEGLEASIKNLSGLKTVLLKRLETIALSGAETLPVEERFKLWYKYGVKKDYRWISNIESKTGIDLFEHDVFIYWSKNETIDTHRVYDKIFEFVHFLSLPEIEQKKDLFQSRKLERQNVTLQTCHEWMEEVMRLNFGSCRMDW